MLPLSSITCDERCQPRATIHPAWVRRYAEALQRGETLPAVDVFQDRDVYYLADGYHRVAAARLAGLSAFPATIHPGTLQDAIVFSAATNSAHGLPRSRADLRRAIERILAECGGWSDNAIARHCHCDARTVAKIRAALGEPTPVRTVTRGSVTYALNVARIGRRVDQLTRTLEAATPPVKALAEACGIEQPAVVEALDEIREKTPELFEELIVAKAVQGSRGEAIPLDNQIGARELKSLLDETLHQERLDDPAYRRHLHIADGMRAARLKAVVAAQTTLTVSAGDELHLGPGDVIPVGQHVVVYAASHEQALAAVRRIGQPVLAFLATYEGTRRDWREIDDWGEIAPVIAVAPPLGEIQALMRATSLPCRASLSAHLGKSDWIYTALLAKEPLKRQPWSAVSLANGKPEYLAHLLQNLSHIGEFTVDLDGAPEAALVAHSLKRRVISVCTSQDGAHNVAVALRHVVSDTFSRSVAA